MKKDHFTQIVAGDLCFDPQRDIQAVDQLGFVDLHQAFVTASVPGDLVIDDSTYNGVDEPASLVGRPSDVFDAYRKAEYVKRAESASQANAGDATGGDSE